MRKLSVLFLFTIHFVAMSQRPVAAFSISTSELCIGDTVKLQDQSSNNPTLWIWSTPGGQLANGGSSVAICTYSAAGNYTISLTAFNSAGVSTNSATHTLVVYPDPTVTAQASHTRICRGMPIVLNASGAVNYLWNYTLTGQSATVMPLGNITYTAIGTDTNGCSSAGSVYIIVFIDCMGLGEGPGMQHWLQASYDPLNKKYCLESAQAFQYKLLSVEGTLLVKGTFIPHRLELDLASIPDGIYVLSFAQNERTGFLKFLKN